MNLVSLFVPHWQNDDSTDIQILPAMSIPMAGLFPMDASPLGLLTSIGLSVI